MKSHLTKVSLALLSAAFLLGCQEQGSEPVGPEGLGPEFKLDCDLKPADHPCHGGSNGGENEDATFTAIITGDVKSVEDILLGPPTGRKKNLLTLTGMPGGPAAVLAELDLPFLQGVTDGDDCFAGVFIGPLSVGLEKAKDPGNAKIQFDFDATGTDGFTVVKYKLELLGGIQGNWPPGDNETTTIGGGTFSIGHSSGPGSSVACTGGGDLTFSMEVENTTSQ